MARRFGGDAQVIATARRKGGIGTTTTNIALATGLAMAGYEVLFIEGDDNREAARRLLAADSPYGPAIDDQQTVYNLFDRPSEGLSRSDFRLPLDQLVGEIPGNRKQLLLERGWRPTTLRFVPGTRGLRRLEKRFEAKAQADLSMRFQPYLQLHEAIATIRRDFDFIIIDTPSMLSMITTNELMAAGWVLFVMDLSPDSIYNFNEAHEFYKQAVTDCRELGVRPPQPLGVVLNKYRADRPTHRKRLLQYGFAPHQLVPYAQIACFPFDPDTCEDAEEARRPVHIVAPQSALGSEMYQLCRRVEELVAAPLQMGGRR